MADKTIQDKQSIGFLQSATEAVNAYTSEAEKTNLRLASMLNDLRDLNTKLAECDSLLQMECFK
jgi:hypothetical protein